MRSRYVLLGVFAGFMAAATRPALAQTEFTPSDPARSQRCATYARRQVESRGGAGAVGGAARGAIAGATIGAIVDGGEGAGKGAAIGAGAGILAGDGSRTGGAAYRKYFDACMNAPAIR